MQIWYRRLAALLAVFMLLAALAACANDERDDEQAAGPAEAGEKITQAELDWVWQSMRFKDETVTQAEALAALLEERAVLLEAESLGIAPSLEEARQHAQENYNQFLELYASSDSQNVHGAQEAWQALQDYMQYMGLEKEEYLEEAAKAQQVMMAKSAVIENFVAGLPVYEQADTLIADAAAAEHLKDLVEKYRDQLLDEEMAALYDNPPAVSGLEVFAAKNAGQPITQADVDYARQVAIATPGASADAITEAGVLDALLRIRVIYLEAERLDLLPDFAAARVKAEDRYHEVQLAIGGPESPEREQAQQMWDFWQEYRQNMGWTEEELLTNNACSRQIQEAGQALQAQFEADLPQAVLADDLARTKAWSEHFEELVAQYQPQLLSAEQIQFLAENLTGEVTIGYGQ